MEKILVVEDSLEVSRNIVDILTLNGYLAISSENGKQGYEMAKVFLPDLIISDIMMPEDDGYALLNSVRNDKFINTTSFIFLTAKSNYENIRTGMGLGADDYIAKPFSVSDLLLSVSSAIEKKKRINKKLDNIKDSIAMYFPHELRTPLSKILGYSECLEEELKQYELNDSTKYMLSSIHNSAIKLKEVINKFIIYSETTMLIQNKESSSELRKKHLTSAEEAITYAAINVAIKFSRSADIIIQTEDAQLLFEETLFQFMITEILENAFKYSKAGSKVKIEANIVENNYVICISDTGIGIRKEYQQNFSTFTQFERSKHETGGNGLGIATVMNILKIFNGKLLISSEENRFTKVEIEIPIINVDSEQIQLFN